MGKDWTGNGKSIFTTLGASNHTDKEREANDYYATDPIAIDALLQGEAEINHKVWECSAGEGHLSERLIELGYEVRSTDLIDRGYGQGGGSTSCKQKNNGMEIFSQIRRTNMQKNLSNTP